MKIRKFVAPSVPQALRRVRDDLGDQAVILNTRKLPPTSGDPRARVEVTAGLEGGAVVPQAGPAVAIAEPSPRADRRDLLNRVYGRTGAPSSITRDPDDGPGPRWREEVAGDRHIRSAAHWLASLPQVSREPAPAIPPAEASQEQAPVPPAPVAADLDPLVLSQLRQLEDVIHRMARKTSGFELPPELSRLGEQLRCTGLAETHIHACLQGLMRELASTQMDDRRAVAEASAAILGAMLPERLDLRVGRRCKVVAFVGPSGSGKTTAAAKIAAGFARRRQQRGGAPVEEILLVSTDARRVGALAQALAFTDLIGVSHATAYDEAEVAAAVARKESARLVLIDTAGCGPHERDEIARQGRLLQAAGAEEIHLVLDGLTGYDHMVEAARAWGGVARRGRLLFTKMDQGVRPGVVVSAAIECGIPTSYLAVSAGLPGGIRPGDLSPLVEWMTGMAPRPFADAEAGE